MALATRPASVYAGDTYRLPALRGGWNANPNVDLVPPESMTEAININLHRGGRETRGGVVKVNTTAISGGPRILGHGQFTKRNADSFIVTATSDGKIWKDYTTLLASGLTVSGPTSLRVFDDTLYVCNIGHRPQTWDGVAATTSDLANVPTDWSGGNVWPKDMVVHGRGVSRRLWAYGVPGYLEKLYASDTDTDDFSDAQVVTLVIETGDGFGVVGLVEFGNRLIPIGKRRAFLVDDDDPSAANWGYEAAQFEGGVASHRLIVRTPNDVLVMDEAGEFYSIIATQTTGDYAAVSLTRPAYINVWIEQNVERSLLASEAHAVYDPALRAVKLFVVRQGQSQVDTALVYFIDRPPEEAWVRHRYYASGIASTSAVVRASAGDLAVYVGGHDGYVRRLESTESALDDGTAYVNGYTTPDLRFDDPRGRKRYDRGWLSLLQQGDETVQINLTVDGVGVTDSYALVDESGNAVVDESGNAVVGVSPADFIVTPSGGVGRLTDESYAVGITGKRIRAEIYGDTDGERFFISQTLFDYTPLGTAAA